MPKRTSPLIMGDYWLDKRRDGKSADIWQIAFVKVGTNSITYKSTKTRNLEDAKKALETFFLTSRAGAPSIRPPKPPNPMSVPVIPQLYRYWEQHGCNCITSDSIVRHLREFKAFLEQDAVGPNATFDDMDRGVWERYRSWAMSARSYTVEWYGKRHKSHSKGVCGATFRRALASVKAAFNLAYEDRIIPHLWKIPPLPSALKSPPRDRLLTTEEIGAMIGYATDARDEALLNWIRIMLATGVRPVAGFRLVPSDQWDETTKRLDLHPAGTPRTKKRNPRAPVVPQLLTLLLSHVGPWIPTNVKHHTLNRRWRIMREALGFSEEVVPKTFRHTVATALADARVSDLHIAMILGHVEFPSWRVQEAFSPRYYDSVIPTLSELWNEAHRWADQWLNDYAIVSTRRGSRLVVPRSKLDNPEFDRRDPSILDGLTGRDLREARATPDYFTGHGCLARQWALIHREIEYLNANERRIRPTENVGTTPKTPSSLTESEITAMIAGSIYELIPKRS